MSSERGVFAEEYRIWHTPAIGAYLFWRFATIYTGASRDGRCPSCVHFFLLAGLMRDATIVKEYIPRRHSLLGVIKAIKEKGDADLIDGLQSRVKGLMPYTTAAIDIAVASGMLEWDFDSATLRPLKVPTIHGSAKYRCSPNFNKLVGVAELLGKLFAAVPTISDLAALMKVRL